MNDDAFRAAIRPIMAQVFSTALPSLPAHASVDTVATWDSLAHITLIESLRAHFVLPIPMQDAVELLSEDDLVRYIAARVTKA